MAAYGFSGKDARRIGGAVRAVERGSRGGDPGRGRYPVGAGGGNVVERLAKLTHGAIAANGTGTVTFFEFGTTNTLGAQTQVVKNPWPDAAPANKKVKIKTINGVPNCIDFWSCNDA